jgi:hypothetical protein
VRISIRRSIVRADATAPATLYVCQRCNERRDEGAPLKAADLYVIVGNQERLLRDEEEILVEHVQEALVCADCAILSNNAL